MTDNLVRIYRVSRCWRVFFLLALLSTGKDRRKFDLLSLYVLHKKHRLFRTKGGLPHPVLDFQTRDPIKFLLIVVDRRTFNPDIAKSGFNRKCVSRDQHIK